jgi:hypothetical protein
MIPAFERAKTFLFLDCAAAVIGPGQLMSIKFISRAESEQWHAERLQVSLVGSGEGRERRRARNINKKHTKKQRT